MPHIIVEATPRLAADIDFLQTFSAIHKKIAAEGYAELDDFKSRLLVSETHLAGNDPVAEFIVARLVTTNPRPKEQQHAMAVIVHDMLHAAIEGKPRSYWWQCCVLIEPFEKQDYIKTNSRALHAAETVAKN